MTLAFDTAPIDIGFLDVDDWMAEEFLYTLWGLRFGSSSPRSSGSPVHPSTVASAGWLHYLWGFAV